MSSADIYTSEIQQRRLDKELKLLDKITSKYNISTFHTDFGTVISLHYGNPPIHFHLHLEGKFPFQPPKVLIADGLEFPSVADGRDLLKDILQKSWTPNITSIDIINSLESFLNEYYQKQASDPTLADVGTFHLGHPIELNIWQNKPGMGTFYAVEIDLNNPKDRKNRCIVVTHTVILQLELSNQYPGIGHLVSWATLNALANIKRSRTEPKHLSFQWKQIGNNPPYSQLFEMNDSEACIDFISRNMHKLGTLVSKQNPILNLSEEEVTATRIKNMHIDEITQAIAVYENSLETQLNFNSVNSLMALYQQAIEYYSALNDPKFEDYINRLHDLLSNEIIQTVLQSEQEANSPSLKSFSSMKVEGSPSTSQVSSLSVFDEEMKEQFKEEETIPTSKAENKNRLEVKIEEAPLLRSDHTENEESKES